MSSMSNNRKTTIDERVASLKRDRWAVYIGTAITTISILIFFVSPEVLTRITELNTAPLAHLRWWGGFTGGVITGWFTSEHGSGLLTGTKASLYGLVMAYFAAIVLYFLYGALVVGVFPPPGLALIAVLLYYAIPLAFAHFFGGLIGGWLGYRFRQEIR